MQPEERLDALLSRRMGEGMENETTEEMVIGTGELAPLLAAAERLIILSEAEPSSVFSDQLEAALLSHFAASSDGSAAANDSSSRAEKLMTPTAPAAADASDLIKPHARRSSDVRRFTRRPVNTPWRAVAALLLLGVGLVGGITAAARSGLLLNRSGNVTAASDTPALSEGGSVRAHLQQAQDALAAFNQAVNQRLGDEAYQAALSHFADEEAKASADLARLPQGATRMALSAQLAALREHGRHDLRAALPILNWAIRAVVTSILDKLGDMVLKIGQTAVAGAAGHDSYVWTITVQGSGFAPGAVLLVDNQPIGVTVSVSATTLVAQVSSGTIKGGSHHVSVGNPDGTVADGGAVTLTQPDDHGGHGGGSGSGSGGGGPRSGGSGGSGDGGS
jgi:hypothetical protein